MPVFWFPWHAHRLYDGSWENFGGCTLRDSDGQRHILWLIVLPHSFNVQCTAKGDSLTNTHTVDA